MFSMFDFIMILIVLVFAVVGYVRGAIRSVLSFVGGIVSFIIAIFAGNHLSPYIYDMFFKQSINNKVAESVDSALQNGAGSIGENVTNALPDFLKGFVDSSDIINSLNSVTGETSQEITNAAAEAVQQAVSPIIISIISLCVTIIAFILLKIIIGIICHLADVVNKIPVIGTANRITGGVIGLVYGILVVMIIIFIANAIPGLDESGFNNIRESSFLVHAFSNDSTEDVQMFDGTEAYFSTEGE